MDYQPTQIESILLHELAHIRRHDYLTNTLQRCIEGLLFYHPAVWWISAVIRKEREHCCDDLAVSISGDAHEYARALAALEQNRFSPAAVAATGGSLVKRIYRLLYPKTSHAWAPFVAVMIIVITGAATVAAWPAKPSQSNAVAKQPETEQSLGPYSNAYYKWLNEDVAYIVDQAERTAFLGLKTDEERDKFVEQFWERRNPTPGAPNKFKEEHYRRLAHANGHFASGVPGWQTDLGHVYILYGPPDEIESHPRAAGGSMEIWLYHRVEGVGDNATVTFVDSTGRGDFRLSPGGPIVQESPGSAGHQPAQQSEQPSGAHASVHASKEEMKALVLKKIPPEYPELARKANIQGQVVLRTIISKDGDVENLQIVSGHPQLVPAAIEAVKQWKYRPYLQQGKPVEVETEIDVNFTLAK